ncbi:MAG: IclR family transcriptional regulator [Planctomycetes bacterium]|nr:IclR family transcriptional regulator [Planctomycetota bacterium]
MFHSAESNLKPRARGQAPAKPRLNGIDRVLATLTEVARHPRGVRLDELARSLSSPKSSVHRALGALRRSGFVTHDERGDYRLGLEFMRLAFDHYQGMDERALIDPLLRELSARFGETAHFAKLDGSEVVYVGIVAPGGAIIMSSTIGGRNPAHLTAVGKALLMHALPDAAAASRFVKEHGPLQRRTPTSITEAAALARELDASRKRGYAVDREEGERGVNCLAIPVFLGPTAPPIGAVSISGLVARTPLTVLVKAVPEMKAIVRRHLGEAAVS